MSLATFRNTPFYGEELYALHPIQKLKDHPLLAVGNCLFKTFTVTLRIWKPSPPHSDKGSALKSVQRM